LSERPLRLEPVTLRGRFVTLTPMAAADAPGLARVGLDPDLWRWIPTPVTSAAAMEAYVVEALDEARRGIALPFTIRAAENGEAIGSTRYANLRAEDRARAARSNGSAPCRKASSASTAGSRIRSAFAIRFITRSSTMSGRRSKRG
jgi:RimJ/RimL family protein N-acetyltransferase